VAEIEGSFMSDEERIDKERRGRRRRKGRRETFFWPLLTNKEDRD
jgi:hypothetical protein